MAVREDGEFLYYFNGNITISNNTIKDFNRRGIKVKASGCLVTNNRFYNTWSSDTQLRDPQAAVDLVDGSNQVVKGNVFTNINFMSQIKVVTSGNDDPGCWCR